jgi:hypothetical protein
MKQWGSYNKSKKFVRCQFYLTYLIINYKNRESFPTGIILKWLIFITNYYTILKDFLWSFY